MSTYRPDIDGLRAVAIVPVVAYHAGAPGFGGGFVGVDVFFVISGFLITSIILKEIDDGAFSIVSFYDRRVRRIFPAFFAVLAFCLIVGTLLLLPTDLVAFARSAAAATLFSSNFIFYGESGYFDGPSELKPLLHTWSLSVEEQFYLLFPVSLMIARKYLGRRYILLAVVVVVGSFIASVIGLRLDPAAAFYLAPFRAWELGFGALLAMGAVPLSRNSAVCNGAALSGLALIAVSATTYSSETPFPAAAALVPCLGTAMLIWSGQGGGAAINRALSLRPVVMVGLLSYSWYLWHWPLLVFARYAAIRPLHPVETCLVIAASFLAAMLSWRYIERPFRGRGGLLSRPQLLTSAVVVMMLAVAASAALIAAEGFPGRLSPQLNAALTAVDSLPGKGRECVNLTPEQIADGQLCKLGAGSGPIEFLVWGDSHARPFVKELDSLAKSRGQTGLLAIRDACPPARGVARVGGSIDVCAPYADAVFEHVIARHAIRDLLLISRWAINFEGSRYKNEPGTPVVLRDLTRDTSPPSSNVKIMTSALEGTVLEARARGIRVWLMGPIPEIGWHVPSVMARSELQNRHVEIEPTLAEFLERQSDVLRALRSLEERGLVTVLYPHDYLCSALVCSASNQGVPLYEDDDHLSEAGVRQLLPLLTEVFER